MPISEMHLDDGLVRTGERSAAGAPTGGLEGRDSAGEGTGGTFLRNKVEPAAIRAPWNGPR